MFEESIARPDGAEDTDDDQADFTAMAATPLAPNIQPARPVESDSPAVLSGPTGNAFQVTSHLKIVFDEPVDPLSTDPDGVVTVSANGVPIALGFNTFEDDDQTIVINPIGRLPFDRDIEVNVLGGPGGVTDLAGNPLPSRVSFIVHTELAATDPGAVVINEICSSPVPDWNAETTGDGVPFSDMPGTGKVTPSDEWIEFYVHAPGPLDVSDYQLVVYNGPTYLGPAREETSLSSMYSVVRVIGASGSTTSVVQGDRVILGNPSGVLHANTYLALRTASGQLVDALEVGGVSVDTDRGGDGEDNGAPDPGQDGSSTGLFDETVARVPDGADTGDDMLDFSYSAATIGASND